MSSNQSPDMIRKTIVVACSLDVAFRTWAFSVDMWWPKQHSRSGQTATTVVMEPYAGGRFYERTPDGLEYSWGQVIAWNPPYSLAYQWYLGSSPEQPTLVEVQFVDTGSGHTRIEVCHYRSELIGEHWIHTSTIFDHAWSTVLAAYQGFWMTKDEVK